MTRIAGMEGGFGTKKDRLSPFGVGFCAEAVIEDGATVVRCRTKKIAEMERGRIRRAVRKARPNDRRRLISTIRPYVDPWSGSRTNLWELTIRVDDD